MRLSADAGHLLKEVIDPPFRLRLVAVPRYPAPLALGAATIAWLLVSFSAWAIRQRRRRLF